MRQLIPPGPSGNVLITIAIGQSYLEAWQQHALPLWGKYCTKHNLGLIVVDSDLIDPSDVLWKKATWQKMLLGERVRHDFPAVKNICYLDTDVLINSHAPNIFDFNNEEKIGLVSSVKNLPFPLNTTLRRIAFNRNRFYSEDYPLDSALFMTPQMIYKSMGEPEHDDHACAGLIMFNVEQHHAVMRKWFDKYTKDSLTLTAGDQPAFNAEVLKWGNINWLPYEFQALWNYEMAWKYPFLYQEEKYDDHVKIACIHASLLSNYFLHFAGSWYESDMWTLNGIINDNWSTYCADYHAYLDTEVTGEAKGIIRPKKTK